MPTTGSRASGRSGPASITSISDKAPAQAQHGFGFHVGLVFRPNDNDSGGSPLRIPAGPGGIELRSPSGSHVGAVGYGGVVSRSPEQNRIRRSEIISPTASMPACAIRWSAPTSAGSPIGRSPRCASAPQLPLPAARWRSAGGSVTALPSSLRKDTQGQVGHFGARPGRRPLSQQERHLRRGGKWISFILCCPNSAI